MGQPLAPIAVSMGCPAGIGPEIICKMAVRKKNGPASYAVIGKADILRQAAAELRLALDIVPWRPGSPIAAGTLPVFEVDAPCAVPVQWGRPSLEDGRLMARSIEEAVRLVREGALSF